MKRRNNRLGKEQVDLTKVHRNDMLVSEMFIQGRWDSEDTF